jgi:hypothetical protein
MRNGARYESTIEVATEVSSPHCQLPLTFLNFQGETHMQVFCLPTSDIADIECNVCGQKYALYFSRKSDEERQIALQMVKEALAGHHEESDEASAHPQNAFNVPEWNGPAHMSGAAILGGAPPWAA